MNPFAAARSLLDTFWSILDPDEPLFCECSAGRPCVDCSLATPMASTPDWTTGSGNQAVA